MKPKYLDGYNFFDSLKQKKEFWDNIIKSAGHNIKYINTFSYDSTNIFSIVTMLTHYSKKELNSPTQWVHAHAIYIQNTVDTNISIIKKIIPSNKLFFDLSSKKFLSKLNDTLSLVKLIDKHDKNNYRYNWGILNYRRATLNVDSALSNEISLSQNNYIKFTCDKSNIFIINEMNHELKKYNYFEFNSKKSKLETKLNKYFYKSVFDIMTNSGRVYIMYFNKERNRTLFIEEYSAIDLKFIKGYSLNITTFKNITNIYFAGVNNNKFNIMVQEDNVEWSIVSYSYMD